MKINSISKIYKAKNAEPVIALNDVSFELPNKGMVFILGKSGSGKSTLLNVISGLTKVDKGSIEVDNKDITKLSENELCKYRNTLCGFIFQEYNLIPELNVSENIKLALQLQGEKKVDEKVQEVLKLVELTDYEKRKVTELSGGQKQRVAIARAIIKNPKIIFADEPTGALDEQTGRSILELLKKLSKDRLVIIVTHDKGFAKEYKDRIIELKDGKIIKDDGTTNKAQDEEKSEWKKPKLPLKESLKIGCSNFKYHPIRLIATILLSVIAFTFLGVSLNISLSSFQDIAYNAMKSDNVKYSAINKYYKNNFETPLKENEKQDIEERIGKSMGIIKTPLDIELKNTSDNLYYSILPNGVAEISDDLVNVFNLSYVGKLPNLTNEIALTKFTSDVINYLNYSYKNYEEIIGNYLIINEHKYLITAIIDTNLDLNNYSILKEDNSNKHKAITESFVNELYFSIHNYIFVSNLNNYYNESILFNKEVCSLYLTNSYSIKISQLIKDDNTFEIYTLNGNKNGNYLSSELIPLLLQMIDCNIEYNGMIFSNYGELFKALCNNEINADLYIETYEKYKDKYMFPTKFYYFFIDEQYDLKYNMQIDGFFTNYKDDSTIITANTVYQKIYDEVGGKYDCIFISTNAENIKEYISLKDSIRLNNPTIDSAIKYYKTFNVIKKISYVLSIVFALFSIGLLLNFILQSISDKTKTIGILKANGCNNFVLSKIFLAEGIIMAFIIFIVTLLTIFFTYLLLSKRYINVSIYGLKILIIPILLLVVFLFSILGCLFPLIRIRHLSPNDIIIKS